MRIYLNDGWKYFEQWSDEIADGCQGGADVRLPHTNKELPFNCFDESLYQFVSGYNRILHLTDTAQKRFLLTFEAVGHRAEVFVNGVSAAVHNNGYTAFTVDLTEFVHDGDNVIAVKCDSRETLNQPPFGNVIDYLTYGGMYREAYLDVYDGVFVSDVFVRSDSPEDGVKVTVTLGNFGYAADVDFEVSGVGLSTPFCHQKTTTCAVFDDILHIDGLQTWDVDRPVVYTLTVSVGGEKYTTTFGVRKAEFTKDGFFLNGKKLKIVGLNRHQSFAYVGYAMPESMQRRDAQILKNQLHVNAVRTSHYPQSKYFVDECDKLGILVFTEIPGWQHIGDEAWQAQAVENVREMVLQYRNHPSVILWGVRINESLDNDKLYRQTNAVCHELDETRQSGGVRYLKRSHLLEDVYTFNDFNRNGATDRNKVCRSNKPYLVTEYNGHMFPTKTFDSLPHRRVHMLRYAKMLDDIFAAETTSGAFGWCMFDYNTHKDFGSGDRICYHGVTDMFRNIKDAGYVFKSFGGEPFVHACFSCDIGDYPEGDIGQMFVLTNCDYIKVYKGGHFVKRFDKTDTPFVHLPHPPILVDDLIGERIQTEEGMSAKYAELTKKGFAAVAKYGLNHLPLKYKLLMLRVMTHEHRTMANLTDMYWKYQQGWGGKANDILIEGYVGDNPVVWQNVGTASGYKVVAEVSHTTLVEGNTYDVAAVNIKAVDEHGNVCPYVNKAVILRCEGAVELVGPAVVALQGGMFGCYVRSTGVGTGRLYIDDICIDFEVVRK